MKLFWMVCAVSALAAPASCSLDLFDSLNFVLSHLLTFNMNINSNNNYHYGNTNYYGNGTCPSRQKRSNVPDHTDFDFLVTYSNDSIKLRFKLPSPSPSPCSHFQKSNEVCRTKRSIDSLIDQPQCSTDPADQRDGTDQLQPLQRLPIPEDNMSKIEDKDQKRLIKRMIDFSTTEDMLRRGLCNQGFQYSKWTLFVAVQCANIKDITGKKKCPAGYPDALSLAWSQLGETQKSKWTNAASELKQMDKLIEPKKNKHYKNNPKQCPICLDKILALDRHFTDVHFPDHKTNTAQRQFLDALNSEYGLNKNLVSEWHAEFLTFWSDLFLEEKDRSVTSNQLIKRCEQIVEEALSIDGPKSKIYVQVQAASGDYNCDKDSTPSVLKYVGKSSSKQGHFRYFDFRDVLGRVGQEMRRSVLTRVKVYFWDALTDVPESSILAFEQVIISAMFHLDFGSSNVWNVGVESMPTAHPFYAEEPKVRVKIGLLLLKRIFDKYQTALSDGSLFESKELLEHYDKLDANQKTDFLKRLGREEERVMAYDGGRHAKKRKLAVESEDNIQEDEATQLRNRIARAEQLIQHELNAIPQEGSISNEQFCSLLRSIQNRLVTNHAQSSTDDPNTTDDQTSTGNPKSANMFL